MNKKLVLSPWAGLASVAELLLASYVVIEQGRRPDEGIGHVIDYINNGFEQINRAITRLERNLERIIDLLERLPDVISGELDKERIQQLILQTKHNSNHIRALMKTEKSAIDNRTTINNGVLKMATDIGELFERVNKDNGDLSAIISVTPFYSVFAHSFNAIQAIIARHPELHDPKHRYSSPPTIYDHPLHETYVTIADNLIKEYDKAFSGVEQFKDLEGELFPTISYHTEGVNDWKDISLSYRFVDSIFQENIWVQSAAIQSEWFRFIPKRDEYDMLFSAIVSGGDADLYCTKYTEEDPERGYSFRLVTGDNYDTFRDPEAVREAHKLVGIYAKFEKDFGALLGLDEEMSTYKASVKKILEDKP